MTIILNIYWYVQCTNLMYSYTHIAQICIFTLHKTSNIGHRGAHHLKVEGLVDLREPTLADQVQQLKSVLQAM